MTIPSRMNCPFKPVVEHIPEIRSDCELVTRTAKEITTFGECDYSECPYYRESEYRPEDRIYRHCRRAEGK